MLSIRLGCHQDLEWTKEIHKHISNMPLLTQIVVLAHNLKLRQTKQLFLTPIDKSERKSANFLSRTVLEIYQLSVQAEESLAIIMFQLYNFAI